VTYQRKADHYTRLAHEKSYPARSVFKLEEIDRRVRLFAPGMRVLDLGASPGSWLLYIAGRIGRGGVVAGVDLAPLGVALPPNARFALGDVMEMNDAALAALAGTDRFDVVVSDLAPKTSGIRHADQERSWRLFERAVEAAARLLVPGGDFAGKLFFSPTHAGAVRLLAARFGDVRTIRPQATRKASPEIFVVGKGKREAPAQ